MSHRAHPHPAHVQNSTRHSRSSCPQPSRKSSRADRYLNVVHALTYANLWDQLPQTVDGFVSLGLLTPTEVSATPSPTKQRIPENQYLP